VSGSALIALCVRRTPSQSVVYSGWGRDKFCETPSGAVAAWYWHRCR